MPHEHIALSRRGPVAVLTLARPERRNALHAPLWEALRGVRALLGDDVPRVLVIHGAGDHFSAGMDLSPENPLLHRVVQAVSDGDPEVARALVHDCKAALDAISGLPCPTIAAIEGACAGSGLELALTCDLRVASSTAFFSLPELQVGLVPDVGGTVRLVRLVGTARATELVLTGRRLDAATGLAWGLVSRTCDAGRALDTALALAGEVLASAPVATGAVLPVLRAAQAQDDQTAFDAETEAGVAAILGGEALEGASAFLARRRPSWSGDDA